MVDSRSLDHSLVEPQPRRRVPLRLVELEAQEIPLQWLQSIVLATSLPMAQILMVSMRNQLVVAVVTVGFR